MPLVLRRMAWAGLLGAAVLLLWPIAPDTPLWEMPGIGGGGSPGADLGDIVTPIGALISGHSLGDGGDRLQLALGLLLLGFAGGVGLASTLRKRTRPKYLEPSPEYHDSKSGT